MVQGRDAWVEVRPPHSCEADRQGLGVEMKNVGQRPGCSPRREGWAVWGQFTQPLGRAFPSCPFPSFCSCQETLGLGSA